MSYFNFIRRQRKANKSQAVAEFALILPWFLAMICGVLDYGLMISRAQTLAMACREGANTASRTVSGNKLDYGLAAVSNAAAPELQMNGPLAGAVLTEIENPAQNATYVFVVQGGGSNQVAGIGGMNGTNVLALSRLIPSGSNWSSTARKVPFSATNVHVGQIMYVLEGFSSNQFVTPVGRIIGLIAPSVLYDAAYY
jgi:Flp pilus assembly protein TadG